jgi:hypothetical protein
MPRQSRSIGRGGGQSTQKSTTGSQTFAAWFGRSKVVDEHGKPLIMYHGTKSSFADFDIKKFGASDEGLLGKGFYFTYNPEEASSYSLNGQYGNGDAPNVIPVYISLKNPFIIRAGILPDGRTFRDLHRGRGVTAEGGAAIRKIAEKAGHDGILWSGPQGKVLHAVAWKPEQIKSAIGVNRSQMTEGAARVG